MKNKTSQPAAKPAQKPAMKPAEVITVAENADQVVCDGGIGPLGHPQVWYSFDNKDALSCHYCGRKFVKPQAE